MPAIVPHLVCSDASAAIEFYKKAFGAVEEVRMPVPDGSGKLMHAMVRIGGAPVMLVDEFPEWGSVGPQGNSPVTLHHYVEDIDTVFKRALDAGAKEKLPVADMFWGDRYGILVDPFGHSWSLATHVRDVSPEEAMEASKTAMVGCPEAAQQ
ncbi:VOC family protein [Pseudoduganella flava]|uniref:VOC family protein n=2 Tax=Pseudoduganella flava TaxID=871742 RepID=A0ABX6G2C0_9BURK|nr:VOC family protein [Pseudoduganella flava]